MPAAAALRLSTGLICWLLIVGCGEQATTPERQLARLESLAPASVVTLPPGTYELSQPLRFSVPGVRLEGAEDDVTRLRFMDPCPPAGCIQLPADDAQLANLFIEIPGGPAIVANDAKRLRLEQLDLRGRSMEATPLVALNRVREGQLRGLRLRANGGPALKLVGAERVRIIESDFRQGSAGVALTACNAIDLENNRFAQNGVGIHLEGSQASSDLRLYRNRISDNNRVPTASGSKESVFGVGLHAAAVARLDLIDNEWRDHATQNISLERVSGLLARGNRFLWVAGAPEASQETAAATTVDLACVQQDLVPQLKLSAAEPSDANGCALEPLSPLRLRL